MRVLKLLFWDFVSFLRLFYFYARRKILIVWVWLEKHKDIIVDLLVVKRGSYQRPFLHFSLLLLILVGIVGLPVIANTHPSVSSEELAQLTPPSAVLTSLDEQPILTEISQKPRDGVVKYKVIEGDTLGKIAGKFDVSIDTIKWANPDIKGEKLVIDQELNVPPVTGIMVKVKKGDTIYTLAKKYKTDAQNILNYPFNDFADLDTFALSVGQTLIVPDGVMPEAAPVVQPRFIAQVGTVPGTGQFAWPTNGTITQRPVSYHMALDIASNELPPVAAADSGQVILVERQRYGYGWHMIVDHQNGYQTLYAHLSDIYVSVGQEVGRGVVIGKMGSTGRSTGPHLHFEIRQNGVLLNPLGFLK